MTLKFRLTDGKLRRISENDIVKMNDKTIVIRLPYKITKYRSVGGCTYIGSHVARFKGTPQKYTDSGIKEVKLHKVKNMCVIER